MKKVLLFASAFLLMISFQVNASHIMGGEITWECLANGQYQFNMKVYRDCNGVPLSTPLTLNVHNHPTLSQITMNLVQQTDISPDCWNPALQITCNLAGSSSTPISGAVEEFIFQSAPVTISGIPPSQGWVFTWSACCRNAAIDNLINSSSSGHTLRAIMYPYSIGGVPQNANPCYDSSPEFEERPITIICSGHPFAYNDLSSDAELDSLHYEWAQPLDDFTGTWNPPSNPLPLSFASGFSYNSPTPGPALNGNNVAAALNPVTGEITFTSFTDGNYVSVVKVEAWKNGQKVAEVYRDFQRVLVSCAIPNSWPTIVPPFNGNSSFDTVVYAGDFVSFNFQATDFDTLLNGNYQTISLEASGGQFDTNYTSSTNGCPNPPCATLNPPPPFGNTLSMSSQFSWQTDCNHLTNSSSPNSNQSNIYNFVFKAKDNNCPVPGQSLATISIKVLPLIYGAKDTSICKGDSVHLNALSANGQYIWSPSTGLSDTTIANPWAYPHTTTTYTVTDTTVYAACNSYQLTVYVDSVPPPMLSTGDTLTVLNAQNYVSFQWYLNDTTIAGANASTYIPVQAGLYSVQCAGANGCSNSSVAVRVNLNIEEWAAEQLRVYPNPFETSTHFEWTKIAQTVNLTLIDIYGKQVASYKAKDVKAIAIERNSLSKGVYFYQLLCDEQSFRGKLIVK